MIRNRLLTCTLLTVSALKICFTVEKSDRKMELALMIMMVWQVWLREMGRGEEKGETKQLSIGPIDSPDVLPDAWKEKRRSESSHSLSEKIHESDHTCVPSLQFAI